MCLLDRHYGENMNLFPGFIDMIESRECMAYVEAIGVIPPLNTQALLIAPTTRKRIFPKAPQFFHDNPLTFRAETLNTRKSFCD